MQPPEHRDDGTDARALCERTGVPLERHHLVPENRARSPVAPVCPPCHDQLHATFSDEELRESYDTVEALRESDRTAAFVSFVSGTDRVDVHVAGSEHVRTHRGRPGPRPLVRPGPVDPVRNPGLPRSSRPTARARRSRARRRTAPG